MHNFTELRKKLGIPLDKDILGFIEEQDAATANAMNLELAAWEVRPFVFSFSSQGRNSEENSRSSWLPGAFAAFKQK